MHKTKSKQFKRTMIGVLCAMVACITLSTIILLQSSKEDKPGENLNETEPFTYLVAHDEVSDLASDIVQNETEEPELTESTEASKLTDSSEEDVAEPTEEDLRYTPEELEMLAIVIYCEAGADSVADSTRQMVGEVVLNRIESEYFPDTMYSVLTAPSQYGCFSWTGVVWPQRASQVSEAHAVARAYECAESLLSGNAERLLPSDTVFQAGFPQGATTVIYQDGIYFCR